MTAPTVSLIMTVRDGESHLEEAIDSVLQQSYQDWELIIWDDGSEDGTAEIVADRARHDSRIQPRGSEAIGRRRALTRAHACAKGALVGWVDADDRLGPEALAETVAVLEDEPDCGMIYTDHVIIDAEGKSRGTGRRCGIPYSPHRLLRDFMTFHFRLIRREIFDDVGGIAPELDVAIDYDLCLRISERARVRHLAEPHYFYRRHASQMSCRQRHAQVQASGRAIRAALRRRGLVDAYTLAVDAAQGRFRLCPRTEPHAPEVSYWPARPRDVYQRELYGSLQAQGVHVRALGSDLPSLMSAVWRGRAGRVLHVHDVSPIAEAPDEGSAAASHMLFVSTLSYARLRGQRIVWLDRAPLQAPSTLWVKRAREALAKRCWRVVRHGGTAASRCVVAPHPHYSDAYPIVSRAYARDELSLSNDRVVVLLDLADLASNEQSQSGLRTIVGATASLPITLLLATRQDARAEATSAGPDVHVVTVDDGRLPVVYGAADAVVLPPSPSSWDPLVIGMSMAKPIVAPDSLDAPGLPSENPFYDPSPPRIGDSLSTVVGRLLSDPLRLASVGRDNRARCIQQSWDDLVALSCPGVGCEQW